ncbi:zinc-ribbon domain-containing protein [Candidatus Pelagibacter sp.]|nr:zinc-ribbon domain-containing protein [Candidatus Pelagibacter sp.]
MIITCPNCNKQFKIDNSLIPDDGRDLQCGSCNHVWFYNIKDEKKAPLTLNENISDNIVKPEIKTKDKNLEFNKILKQEKIIKTEKKKDISKEFLESAKRPVNKGSKLFAYLIVFIISFVALIILIDTLKNPLINVFPGLEIILFNLFETLKDIKLFIIDLT